MFVHACPHASIGACVHMRTEEKRDRERKEGRKEKEEGKEEGRKKEEGKKRDRERTKRNREGDFVLCTL